jgi:multimeric flavodoxin WrbA
MTKTPKIRTGQGPEQLSKAEFELRFRQRFYDPAFAAHEGAIQELLEAAWDGYDHARKSPVTQKAGPNFHDPEYEISVEWLNAKAAIDRAQQEYGDMNQPARILLICGAARNDKTCPGEMSKSYRMVDVAKTVLEEKGARVDVLDLSLLTSDYGKVIYPCKGCVSTAMPLCHWPCSCYPNHGLGQVNDWMSEIYPRWVAAHGVMIVTPVYWYQAPSTLKLMIDRLVCADGGNPDPTTTHGKNAGQAKALELRGWTYPRHLSGRVFSLIVHGDTEGTDILRRSLTDWLQDMHLIAASSIDRYIGYYEPYATSHQALDRDDALQTEVRNAAKTLLEAVALARSGKLPQPGAGLTDPRPK